MMIRLNPSRLMHVSSLSNAMKSDLPIKWRRPEKIPCYKPEKSGDLKPLCTVDRNQLALEFRDSEELKTADDRVRKLFTLEFLPYKKTVEHLREEYLNKVRRHQFDEKSPEARVAKMTADVRDMQKHVDEYPYDVLARVRLKETIDKRKKLLKMIRKWDYKCFEYLLEKLELVYKPFPFRDVYRRIERKRSLRMLTQEYCDKIVSGRLEEYKEILESKKEDFLVEKIETLKWIMKEEAECGATPTVTQEDLQATEEQLIQLRQRKTSVETDQLD